jgi:copper chaperone CopZ
MHCSSCVMSIDGELEDTDGVIEVKTSYVKQQTEVTFDSKKITPEKILSVISDLGYVGEMV